MIEIEGVIMADETPQDKKEKKAKPVAADVPDAKKEAKAAAEPVEVTAVKSTPPWPLITIGVFATIMILALFMIGWFVVAVARPSAHVRTDSDPLPERTWQDTRLHRGGDRIRGFGTGITQGVVTEVNDNTITVAGNGKKVTVKMTDDTSMAGSNGDVAVNDSVIIFGSKEDDGTVMATRVVVTNSGSFNDINIEVENKTVTPGA